MEKRKLKYMYQRIPKEKVGVEELREKIFQRTGFAKMHIKDIMDAFFKIVEEEVIDNKKSISLPNVGLLYPSIKPGKNVVKINNFKDEEPKLMYMPDRWVCRFKVKPTFAKKLLEVKPTKEEVDNIYRD